MLSTRADQRPGSARGLNIGGGRAVRTSRRAIHQPGCACRGGRRGSNHRRWNELSMTRTWCRRPSVASSTPSSATRAFASRCGEEPDEPERGSRPPRAATLLALLLLVGAGFGLALRFGVFGTARANQPLLLPAARRFAHRNTGWFWLVLAAVVVVLALLALRWLLQQVGTDRVRELDLKPNTAHRRPGRPGPRAHGHHQRPRRPRRRTPAHRGTRDQPHPPGAGAVATSGPVARPTRRRLTPTGALTGVQVKAPARTSCHVPPLHHDHRRGRLTFRTDDRGVPAAATC